MVAHHTNTGCNLRPGDLLGTGTISCDVSPLGAALLKCFLPQDHLNKHLMRSSADTLHMCQLGLRANKHMGRNSQQTSMWNKSHSPLEILCVQDVFILSDAHCQPCTGNPEHSRAERW